MTGPPECNSYRNVQVCSLCIINNTKYGEMFPVVRILRKAAMAGMAKLVQKFGGAEADEDTLRLYTDNALAMQMVVYKNMKLNHTGDKLIRSWVLKACIKAGHIQKEIVN